MNVFLTLLCAELCRVLGTEEQVYIRRRRSLFDENIQNIRLFLRGNKEIAIESGSHAEGLFTQGSDIDLMGVLCRISVVPPLLPGFQIQPDADLVLETEQTKPGFAFLRVITISTFLRSYPCYLPAVVQRGGISFLSSHLFVDLDVQDHKKIYRQAVRHGPSCTFTTTSNTERDLVACFQCKDWPERALEWKGRERPNNWPARDVIQEIVNDGFLLVPIGNQTSKMFDIEWRISFSKAEKKLVHSMNHTQMLCYGLLKLYLKHIIESEVEVKGLLCSYFLKTCLFYSIEEDNVSWDTEHFMICFWNCFKRLFIWVKQGYCPNYFIKDNNMFEGKIYGHKQIKLIEHLTNLYQTGTGTLIKIPYLTNFFRQFVGSLYSFSNMSLDTNISSKELEYLIDREILGMYTIIYMVNYTDVNDYIAILNRYQVKSPLEHIFVTIFRYHCNLFLTQMLFFYFIKHPRKNKEQYKRLKMLKNFILKECTGYDICSGLLQYATLCYNTGQIVMVVRVIVELMKKFKPHVMYNGQELVITVEKLYISEMCGRSLTLTKKMKQATAHTHEVITDCCMYPVDIETEVKRFSRHIWTLIPPQLYTCILLFLCCKALGYTNDGHDILEAVRIASYCNLFVTDLERPLAMALFQKCDLLNIK